jgi:tetratricopeptide (TPR) repeat protein
MMGNLAVGTLAGVLLFTGAGPLTAAVEPAKAGTSPQAAPTPAGATGTAGTAATVAAPPPASPEAAAASIDDRLRIYTNFREHFTARRFTEARDAAQEVVDLSEKKFGADTIEMVIPLTNLATCQVRLQAYSEAERNYLKAVKIVEMREGGLSRRILNPLLGLGALYYAAQQYDRSIDVLRRAVDTSRKLDGLFNIDQLNLVQVLIDTYVALDMVEDAEREQQYALRLSESLYGQHDLRLLPALDRLAQWREYTGRYRLARHAHTRALDIVRRKAGKRDARIVGPLRGIARTYRMEFLYGTYEEDEQLQSMNTSISGPMGVSPVLAAQEPRRLASRLDPDGLDALRLAAGILENQPDESGLRAETLLDIGDWQQLSNDFSGAEKSYRAAWEAYMLPGDPGIEVMQKPVQIYYKPPSTATRRESTDTREIAKHDIEVSFTVRSDGRISDVRTVSSDPPDQAKSVEIAVRRARYRPAFVNGAPVVTKDQRLHQTLYLTVRNTATAGH